MPETVGVTSEVRVAKLVFEADGEEVSVLNGVTVAVMHADVVCVVVKVTSPELEYEGDVVAVALVVLETETTEKVPVAVIEITGVTDTNDVFVISADAEVVEVTVMLRGAVNVIVEVIEISLERDAVIVAESESIADAVVTELPVAGAVELGREVAERDGDTDEDEVIVAEGVKEFAAEPDIVSVTVPIVVVVGVDVTETVIELAAVFDCSDDTDIVNEVVTVTVFEDIPEVVAELDSESRDEIETAAVLDTLDVRDVTAVDDATGEFEEDGLGVADEVPDIVTSGVREVVIVTREVTVNVADAEADLEALLEADFESMADMVAMLEIVRDVVEHAEADADSENTPDADCCDDSVKLVVAEALEQPDEDADADGERVKLGVAEAVDVKHSVTDTDVVTVGV